MAPGRLCSPGLHGIPPEGNLIHIVVRQMTQSPMRFIVFIPKRVTSQETGSPWPDFPKSRIRSGAIPNAEGSRLRAAST